MRSSEQRVAWGLGSGRHLEAAAKAGESLLVLAVDRSPHELSAVTGVIEGRATLVTARTEGRLEVVLGDPRTILHRFTHARARGDLLIDRASLHAAVPACRSIAALVERIHLECREAPRRAPLLLRNVDANARAIAGALPLTALDPTQVRGHPAFVVAAGPSAAGAMAWLGRARRLGPVVAVDTAVPLCRAHNVVVDVVASVDPQPASARHVQSGTGGSLLAFQPFCAPALVAAFDARVVATPLGDKLGDRMAHALELPAVPCGGTVLLYALQVAAHLGADPIVLVGADFAHVGGLTHAEGTVSARRSSPTGVAVPSWRGSQVATTHTLDRFRQAVEHHIATDSGRAYLALDGGGARIAGASLVTQAEFSEAPNEAPTRWLATPLSYSDDEQDRRLARVRAIIRKFDCASEHPQHHRA